jgi:hypothetical protein
VASATGCRTSPSRAPENQKADFANGKKRSIWVPVKETRPNHEWDKCAMLMAFLAIAGIVSIESADASTSMCEPLRQ